VCDALNETVAVNRKRVIVNQGVKTISEAGQLCWPLTHFGAGRSGRELGCEVCVQQGGIEADVGGWMLISKADDERWGWVGFE
jgi:hypothetical protein